MVRHVTPERIISTVGHGGATCTPIHVPVTHARHSQPRIPPLGIAERGSLSEVSETLDRKRCRACFVSLGTMERLVLSGSRSSEDALCQVVRRTASLFFTTESIEYIVMAIHTQMKTTQFH